MVIVRVLHDCHWKILINDHNIHLKNNSLLQFSKKILDMCNKVMKMLSEIELGRLCIGNLEEKFYEIRDRRKGKFVDRLGMFQLNDYYKCNDNYAFFRRGCSIS